MAFFCPRALPNSGNKYGVRAILPPAGEPNFGLTHTPPAPLAGSRTRKDASGGAGWPAREATSDLLVLELLFPRERLGPALPADRQTSRPAGFKTHRSHPPALAFLPPAGEPQLV